MNEPTSSLSLALKSLGYLLRYPISDAIQRNQDIVQVRHCLAKERDLPPKRLGEIHALLDSMACAPPLRLEAEYVQTFDTRRNQSLHLFEHVHGDSRDRGPAMIDLTQTYIQKGLYLHDGELPDYLPVVLEFASLLPRPEAQSFLSEFAHLLTQLYSALVAQGSRYACVFAALLELAHEPVSTHTVPPEPALDFSWEEPLAFDGCGNQGQQQPGQPQVIQIVRPATSPVQGVHV